MIIFTEHPGKSAYLSRPGKACNKRGERKEVGDIDFV